MRSLALMLVLAVDGGPSPREAVLAILQQQVGAWNRGELEAFCAVYADDAVFVSPPRAGSPDAGVPASDGVTRGRAEVLARYKRRYPDRAAMGQLELEPNDVRESGGAVSIAARWTLRYPGKPPVSGNTLIVFFNQGGAWRIVQDASM